MLALILWLLSYHLTLKGHATQETHHYKYILTTSYSDEGIMANGRQTFIGATACPRDWKLGTFYKLEGKTYQCTDHYNKKLSQRIDIFNPDYQQAKAYGVQYKVIEFK